MGVLFVGSVQLTKSLITYLKRVAVVKEPGIALKIVSGKIGQDIKQFVGK